MRVADGVDLRGDGRRGVVRDCGKRGISGDFDEPGKRESDPRDSAGSSSGIGAVNGKRVAGEPATRFRETTHGGKMLVGRFASAAVDSQPGQSQTEQGERRRFGSGAVTAGIDILDLEEIRASLVVLDRGSDQQVSNSIPAQIFDDAGRVLGTGGIIRGGGGRCTGSTVLLRLAAGETRACQRTDRGGFKSVRDIGQTRAAKSARAVGGCPIR